MLYYAYTSGRRDERRENIEADKSKVLEGLEGQIQ